jgi:high affinity Mn2+ porin
MLFLRSFLTLALLATLLASAAGVCAQAPAASAPVPPAPPKTEPAEDPQGDAVTMFPHSESSRWWVSGQANVILQWHGSFPAKYTGANSLRSFPENATSKLYTLYLGYQLTPTTELFLDMESAGGHGISDALGLAGFTNLDVIRNPDLSQVPYVARFMLRQIIPLSDERVTAGRGPFGLATSLPARRIEIRFGKFSMVDFFDVNTWGADSHLQFLNWTVDNSAIYDYAANTRGYTDGAMVEYDDHWWSVRFAEGFMPKVANGINLDVDLMRARAENLETDFRGHLFPHRAGVLRLLSYLNHADMGSYRGAISSFLAGKTPSPDILSTRRQGRHKYGFGLNFEQEITSQVGVFGRLGWSDGRNEAFAYTEVDRTLQLGGFAAGGAWHRRNDRAGVVFALNAISPDHRQYLALGGKGFLLGDGALTYGQERIFEGFYTAQVWRGIFTSFDLQRITNPGYNRDRGPVLVPGLRLHVDF